MLQRVDGGSTYAAVRTAARALDSADEDEEKEDEVNVSMEEEEEEDDDDDEYEQHDDELAEQRSCSRPVVVALLVSVALFSVLGLVVSYHDGVALPPLPDTVSTKVDKFKQMFNWRDPDTALDYQPPPPPTLLSDLPPAVSALHACQAAYNTTRALLVVLNSAADEASLKLLSSHLSSEYDKSKHGFCILAVYSSTDAAASASSSSTTEPAQAKPLVHVTAADMRALTYEYVEEVRLVVGVHDSLDIPFAKTAGSLLLMHAGFDVIVDVHAPLAAINSTERIKQITAIDYAATTYTTADSAPVEAHRTKHHCSATVQLASVSNTLLQRYKPPATPAALAALLSHELLAVEPSSVRSTTVFSPAFAGLYLPSSTSSIEAADSFRSLVYLTFLSFLWVPTRSTALLARHGLTTDAAAVPSGVGAPSDIGPAPSLLKQSHINACIVRWIHSEGDKQPKQQQQQADKGQEETADKVDKTAKDDEAVQLRHTVQLLSDSMLGHPSDAQLLMRKTLLAGDVTQGEAVRRSQEADQLVQQIYTYVSQHSTGVVTTRDIRELRAFHNDMRNIALTLQHSRNKHDAATTQPPSTANPIAVGASSLSSLVPISTSGPLTPHNTIPPAVVAPRQSRVAVCIQFNYAAENHSLHVLLTYHARLHHHLMLSMPVRAAELSTSQRQLLAQFPDITFIYCASYRGYFQYRCLHQCLVQSRALHSDSSGMMFLADDAWFNFTQSVVQWDKWLVDEFWFHSKAYLMDMSQPFSAYHGSFEPVWFHEGRDYHIRLQRSYWSWPQRYRDALNSVYGQDLVATEALSDILYVPRADSQMDNMIEVLAEQMGQVDVWCEVMTAVLVDLAMILSGHRPNLPIFAATSQQVGIFLNKKNWKDKDGVVRYVEGIQLESEQITHPQRFYQYMRRGATTVTRAMQNDSLLLQDSVAASMSRFPAREKGMASCWLDEQEQMRLQHRTADFYDPPQPIASCAIHNADDGFLPSSALRPVLLRPDGNVVLPHRKDIKLARVLVDGEGTGWIHPIKMSDKSGEFTMLGMESLNRMVVQLSGLLYEDEWWRRRTQCEGGAGGGDVAKTGETG